MFKYKNKKGFTLIELVVVMAIIGILVLLAMPKFMGNTQQARLTQIKSDTKQVENASERYYIDNQDWPRLTDVPYTSAQILSFAQEITDKTGQVVTLDSTGNYYEIDYTKLQKYVQKPKDNTHYIIQNPVGEIYYLKDLTALGKNKLDNVPLPNTKPTAVITMTPATALTTETNIVWNYTSSTDIDGDTITNAEWQNNQDIYTTAGTYTVKLRVQDSRGLWSDWTDKTFDVIYSRGHSILWNHNETSAISDASMMNNGIYAINIPVNKTVKFVNAQDTTVSTVATGTTAKLIALSKSGNSVYFYKYVQIYNGSAYVWGTYLFEQNETGQIRQVTYDYFNIWIGSASQQTHWAPVYDNVQELDNSKYLFTSSSYQMVVEGSTSSQSGYCYGSSVSGVWPGACQNTVGLRNPSSGFKLSDGSSLIADTGNNRVIKVSATGPVYSGIFTTPWQYGTTGTAGSTGTLLNGPTYAESLSNGNILITDKGNHRVIEVNPSKEIVWQYGTTGVSGNGVNKLNNPEKAKMLSDGSIMIIDSGNNRVIKIK